MTQNHILNFKLVSQCQSYPFNSHINFWALCSVNVKNATSSNSSLMVNNINININIVDKSVIISKIFSSDHLTSNHHIKFDVCNSGEQKDIVFLLSLRPVHAINLLSKPIVEVILDYDIHNQHFSQTQYLTISRIKEVAAGDFINDIPEIEDFLIKHETKETIIAVKNLFKLAQYNLAYNKLENMINKINNSSRPNKELINILKHYQSFKPFSKNIKLCSSIA